MSALSLLAFSSLPLFKAATSPRWGDASFRSVPPLIGYLFHLR
jgi:hypothetical protein